MPPTLVASAEAAAALEVQTHHSSLPSRVVIAGGIIAVISLMQGISTTPTQPLTQPLTPPPPPPPMPPPQPPTRLCDSDDHHMCDAWVRSKGMCNNERDRKRCPHICGLCAASGHRHPPATRKQRCRRDNTSAAFGVGDIEQMFARTLADFPQYSPLSLSSSPRVLLLRDFLSAEEAAVLRSVCRESRWQPSTDIHDSTVRTSSVCWCNFRECFADPVVHNVTRRIGEVTGAPYGHGEDLQFVRYRPGEFYRSHHDQASAVWSPQGPRVLVCARPSNPGPLASPFSSRALLFYRPSPTLTLNPNPNPNPSLTPNLNPSPSPSPQPIL